MEFRAKLLNSSRGLYLYGTTPPHGNTPRQKVDEIAEKLAKRLSCLDLDAINIYDIKEEAGRNPAQRPFPFLPTLDTRQYATILRHLINTEIVNYKCVVHHPKLDFAAWLSESWEKFNLRYLTLVGGSTSHQAYPGPALSQSAHMTAMHQYDFTFGGVTIAERHTIKGDEHLRLIKKTDWGMTFFTSQVIYEANATIQLLHDYYQACYENNLSPVRIILTFAPCGHLKTLQFLRWLGVNVPDKTAQAILSAQSPVDKSIEICCSNLQQILASFNHQRVRLGINVESVSIKKDEINASIDLFHELKVLLESFYKRSEPL